MVISKERNIKIYYFSFYSSLSRKDVGSPNRVVEEGVVWFNTDRGRFPAVQGPFTWSGEGGEGSLATDPRTSGPTPTRGRWRTTYSNRLEPRTDAVENVRSGSEGVFQYDSK